MDRTKNMLEKVILILEKKGYSWDLRFQDPEKKTILMLSYHTKDVSEVDNFMEASHFYVQFKEERLGYFFYTAFLTTHMRAVVPVCNQTRVLFLHSFSLIPS